MPESDEKNILPTGARKFRLWSERTIKKWVPNHTLVMAQRLQPSVSAQDLLAVRSDEKRLVAQKSVSLDSFDVEPPAEDEDTSNGLSPTPFEASDTDLTVLEVPRCGSFQRSVSDPAKDGKDISSTMDTSGPTSSNACYSNTAAVIESLLSPVPTGLHMYYKKFCPTAKCFICKEQFGLSRAEKCKKCRLKVHSHCKSKLGQNKCGYATMLQKLLTWAASQEPEENGFLSQSTWEHVRTHPPPRSAPAPSEVPEIKEIPVDVSEVVANINTRGDDEASEKEPLALKLSCRNTLRHETSLDKCRRRSMQRNQSSTEWASDSWEDVTIPLDDITFHEDTSLIGIGRFGEVHRGYYHMDVAVKLLNMDHVEYEKQLETFREEVKSFVSTRHDNIVLFIGCSLVPPYLGIVMNYCKGPTLYEVVHHKGQEEVISITSLISMAIQICQGMSYLHCKKILHKDLRTRNLFLEHTRVVISDFGIFSSRRLFTKKQYKDRCKKIWLPAHWLQYQAPEIIRSLNIPDEIDHHVYELSFSKDSDIFAFGSVWFELVTSEFPFDGIAPEVLMWKVGNGLTQPLEHPRLRKDDKVLSDCWSFELGKRPKFQTLYEIFNKMMVKSRLRGGGSLPTSSTSSASSI